MSDVMIDGMLTWSIVCGVIMGGLALTYIGAKLLSALGIDDRWIWLFSNEDDE